jgi:hypothetical protein
MSESPAQTYTMVVPLFGKCRLLPHSMDEGPPDPVCYVELEEKPGNLTLAFHKRDEFLNRKLKPFSGRISRWYSVVKDDGSPLF